MLECGSASQSRFSTALACLSEGLVALTAELEAAAAVAGKAARRTEIPTCGSRHHLVDGNQRAVRIANQPVQSVNITRNGMWHQNGQKLLHRGELPTCATDGPFPWFPIAAPLSLLQQVSM